MKKTQLLMNFEMPNADENYFLNIGEPFIKEDYIVKEYENSELERIKKSFKQDGGDKCVFCGHKKNTNRSCCSSLCSKHLKEYSSISISPLILKQITQLPTILEKVSKIKKLASKSGVSIEAYGKHYISMSQRAQIPQSHIGLTMNIVIYYSEFNKLPDFIR